MWLSQTHPGFLPTPRSPLAPRSSPLPSVPQAASSPPLLVRFAFQAPSIAMFRNAAVAATGLKAAYASSAAAPSASRLYSTAKPITATLFPGDGA